ncbi:MAG: cyanophycin synthetase [Candidatus Saccharibacteria bacterium]
MTITNFSEANEQLARFYDNSRTEYTLDNMQNLMAYLGNPQEQYRVIHVAGTSGKTSTAYYAAALLHTAGYATGLTISPHVDLLNERLQIDGRPLPEAEFCAELGKFLELIEASPVQPSWFELLVAFAYWKFAASAVDYAVVEVGLGGLKDGTNVISRADKICILTDIGLDHTKILGRTTADIAFQKAGIIHTGNQVFSYRPTADVRAVIEQRVGRVQAHLTLVDPPTPDSHSELPIFQQRNLQLARQAVNAALRRDGRPPLSAAQLARAALTYIPGRMEIIKLAGKTLILDGAHNAQKFQALSASLQARFPQQKIAVLAAFAEGDGQRLGGALPVISRFANDIIVTSFVSAKDYVRRSVDTSEVAAQAKAIGLRVLVEPNSSAAFRRLLARSEPVLLVTGSFYLLNHIRPLIDSYDD